MTTADTNNTDLAVRLLQSIPMSGPDAADTLAPDAVWWVLGRPDETPAHTILTIMQGLFVNGRMEVDGVTADGDRVAVEARSFMTAKDGREYSNSYHFLVEFRDGLITRVKEYCDTARTNAFFAPA